MKILIINNKHKDLHLVKHKLAINRSKQIMRWILIKQLAVIEMMMNLLISTI
jgi:hypothetical protein